MKYLSNHCLELTVAVAFALGLPIPSFSQDNRVGVDPFEVKRQIDDRGDFNLSSLWRRLGIGSQMQPMPGQTLDPNERFEDCSENCVAEIYMENLDDDPDREVLLKLYQRWGYCRFLVFNDGGANLNPNTRWRFLGFADHAFARYYMPQHATSMLGSNHFLVVTGQGASGTGVSLSYARWHEMSSRGMLEVLALPEKGTECSGVESFCRQFESNLPIRRNEQGVDTIRVDFRVSYTASYSLVDTRSEEELVLFNKSQSAVYTRSSDFTPYEFSAERSNVTAEEIRAVYEAATMTCEEFLRFNLAELLKVAPERGRHQQWLRRYMESCPNTAEKSAIMRAIDN